MTVEWSPRRLEQLRALWGQPDMSARLIGERLGLSKNAVIAKARRLGLRALGSPITSYRRVWTAARSAQLRSLWANGVGHAEIAAILGVSPNSLQSEIDRIRREEGPAALPRRDRRGIVQTLAPSPARSDARPPPSEPLPLPPRLSARTCQWVISERPLRYCDEAVDRTRRSDGTWRVSSYCIEHHGIAYVKSSRTEAGAAHGVG